MDPKTMLNQYFYNCIYDIFKQVADFISQILFEPKAMPEFFQTMYGIFLGFGATMMTCIVLFKLIQHLLDVSNGESQTTLGAIITKTIKASAMVLIAPILLNVIVGQIVYPLGEYIFEQIGSDLAKITADYLVSCGSGFSDKYGIVFIIGFGFVTVAFACFFFKMCVYHADLIILQVMSVKAAVSMCADDNNYMSVWWREVLSQVTTILVQVMMVAGVTKILASPFEWYNLMLLIGFCVNLIKGPSVLRNMWYSTGSGKSVAHSGSKITQRLIMAGIKAAL